MHRGIGFALGFLFSIVPAIAQSAAGSISGIVTDSSGAVLSAVAITVTDLGRNTAIRTASNSTGFYVAPSLPPGNYRVTASKPGFREYVLDNVPLLTQQKATANITLEDRKSTRLNSSHSQISYAVFCLKKKNTT